nr:MAG TPA: hypothetical protein [Caudoviricetes sp.]
MTEKVGTRPSIPIRNLQKFLPGGMPELLEA